MVGGERKRDFDQYFPATQGNETCRSPDSEYQELVLIQEPSGEHAGKLGSLIDAGGFVTALDSVWPVAEFGEAVERMESGKARGKVVIEFVPHV